MPNWKEIVDEINDNKTPYDIVRHKYLADLTDLTGRNVIVFYSGWLQKSSLAQNGYAGFAISDSDKSGFMATIHGMEKDLGLDLILHTPGGEIAATESLVDYLRSVFGTNIRAIIPQIAMSAGTMISLSCNEVVMGKHSSLGPFDPLIGFMPAHGVIEEFNHAIEESKRDPDTTQFWGTIINKYSPTLIGECQKTISWCNTLVEEWLVSGMFEADTNAQAKATAIIDYFGNHALTKSHARHISAKKAEELGVKVLKLEDEGNEALQNAVLSVHHACIATMSMTPVCKIIENQLGVGFIESADFAVS